MKSSLRWPIAFGILVFGLVIAFRFWQSHDDLANVPEKARFIEIVARPVSERKLDRVLEFSQSVENFADERSTCRLAREKILTQNLSRVARDIEDRRFALDGDCRSFSATTLRACTLDTSTDKAGGEACYQSLLFYKADLIARVFQRWDIEKLDAETLIYMFFAKLWRGDLRKPADVASLNALTDRLVEIMPLSPAARKAAVLPRLITDFERFYRGEPLSAETDKYLSEAVKLNPQDAELEEMRIFRQVVMPDKTISLVRAAEVAVKNPSSSIAQYFLAGAFESNGQKKEAVATLKKAIELEPENPRYNNTFEKLVRGESDAFELRLGVNFAQL